MNLKKWEKRLPGDLAMQELHAIREKLQRETKGMPPDEFNQYCEQKIKEFKAKRRKVS